MQFCSINHILLRGMSAGFSLLDVLYKVKPNEHNVSLPVVTEMALVSICFLIKDHKGQIKIFEPQHESESRLVSLFLRVCSFCRWGLRAGKGKQERIGKEV